MTIRDPSPLLLTTLEVAKILRLSVRTLNKMRLEHRGPDYLRLGPAKNARVRYKLADVVRWADDRIVPVASFTPHEPMNSAKSWTMFDAADKR